MNLARLRVRGRRSSKAERPRGNLRMHRGDELDGEGETMVGTDMARGYDGRWTYEAQGGEWLGQKGCSPKDDDASYVSSSTSIHLQCSLWQAGDSSWGGHRLIGHCGVLHSCTQAGVMEGGNNRWSRVYI